jgi:SAM domain (Sterile alpha motif)
MDLGGWLRSLGLAQYEAAFRENAINEAILPKLTPEDLKDIGVTAVGAMKLTWRTTCIPRYTRLTDGSCSAPPASAGRRYRSTMWAFRANSEKGSGKAHYEGIGKRDSRNRDENR